MDVIAGVFLLLIAFVSAATIGPWLMVVGMSMEAIANAKSKVLTKATNGENLTTKKLKGAALVAAGILLPAALAVGGVAFIISGTGGLNG